MVTANNRPNPTCVRNIHTPPITNHIIFIIAVKHPGSIGLLFTSLPKGHRASIPILNVCNPKGMPITVIIMAILAAKYSRAVSNPPKTTQMMFPTVFILRFYYCFNKMMTLPGHLLPGSSRFGQVFIYIDGKILTNITVSL